MSTEIMNLKLYASFFLLSLDETILMKSIDLYFTDI